MRYFVMFGAAIGFLTLLFALLSGGSAPQQAALAAIACAMAVIPYVGWRASQLTDDQNEREKFRAEMLRIMQAQQQT